MLSKIPIQLWEKYMGRLPQKLSAFLISSSNKTYWQLKKTLT